jgi:mannitol/fructose-specific phosphotransferase system IIA component (Ntr-type)
MDYRKRRTEPAAICHFFAQARPCGCVPAANITFRQSVNSWRDAVRLASQPLVQGGMIQPEYTQAMIKIIEDYGPYMILCRV